MRHVFLASVGLVLPVVTESLWAMMNPPSEPAASPPLRPPVFPDVVHIVTTAEFDPEDGYVDFDRRRKLAKQKVEELYRAHKRKPPRLVFEAVGDPEGEAGRRFIEDVRNERENILYANHITRAVRGYCSNPGTVLHMSLAGGRKTMSSYDHSAMMFFGRPEDEMSHVLVRPSVLERAGEQFWWPDQEEKLIQVRIGRDEVEEVATTSEAVSIELVPVPFVRLGVRLPQGIPPEAEDYRELIEFIEFERSGGSFVIDADTLTIDFGGNQAKLTKSFFALFCVFAIARKMGWPGAGPPDEGIGGNAAGYFFLNDLRAGLSGDAKNPIPRDTPALRCLRALLNDDRFQHGNEGTLLLERISQSRIDSRGRVIRDGKTADATSTYRSNLARQLKERVRSPYTLRYLIPESYDADDGQLVVGIPLAPDRIELKGFDPFQLVEG